MLNNIVENYQHSWQYNVVQFCFHYKHYTELMIFAVFMVINYYVYNYNVCLMFAYTIEPQHGNIRRQN